MEKASILKKKENLEPPLMGKELDLVLKAIKEEKGLSPTVVNHFLDIKTSETSGVSKLNLIAPSVLMAGYVATYAATRLAGAEFLPIPVPPVLHQILQAVHNLTTNEARSPIVGEHLPFLLLEAAGAWGAVKTIPNWFKARSKSQKIKEAQQVVKEKIDKGELTYNMPEGHTAAFIGLGDPLAERLQQDKPDQVMLYSNVRIDNQVWRLITKNGQQEEIYRALDQGNFEKAGEVLLLPVKSEDMFLPDKTGQDMTLDEVAAMIDMIDAYCKSRKLLQKKVIIVGSKNMEESYVRRTDNGKTTESRKTLVELVDEINMQREGVGNVEIIDPTGIVMEKIIALANGRRIEFVSTRESDRRYGERFNNLLSSMEYQPEKDKVVSVLYNISDIPTAVKAGKDDIAVILDPSKKQSLKAKGLLGENIIVVPDITLQALSKEVDKS